MRIINHDGDVLNQFFAYQENFRGGVTVASGDLNHDGRDEIITGTGGSGGPHVRVFTPYAELLTQFFAFDAKYRNGVNVASGY